MKRRKRRLLVQSLEDRRLLAAGPYAPAAGQLGSTAISANDPAIVGWASSVAEYAPGTHVDSQWQNPAKATGPAEGVVHQIVSLGRGGSLTLAFDPPIRDGLGADFAVFENAINDTFLELGFVEVSSDGVNFVRFDAVSLTDAPVGSFGALDPTNLHNLAGKYRVGFGTPFDLGELRGHPELDVTAVTHVRLVDIVGDGETKDALGNPIYDPTPTIGSAGLDVDGVGVIHAVATGEVVVDFESLGEGLGGQLFDNGSSGGGGFQADEISLNNDFNHDYQSWTGWAISQSTDSSTADFGNQYGNITGSGNDGSETFAVAYVDVWETNPAPSLRLDPSSGLQFDSLYVTNTTYAALSMRDGDGFAKQFGGNSGDDPDFLRLTISGVDADGDAVGSVEVMLADYRFADNSQDYILDAWTQVDVSPLAAAHALVFSIDGSDTGLYGLNTPAYFAVDNITLRRGSIALDLASSQTREDQPLRARLSRPTEDTSAALTVTLEHTGGDAITVPAAVTIPSGAAYVEFDLTPTADGFFSGEQMLEITALADGLLPTTRALTIQYLQAPSLAFSTPLVNVVEGAGEAAATLVLTRNEFDASTPLDVTLSQDAGTLLRVPSTASFAAGQREISIPIDVLDDDRYGDGQTIVVTAEAADRVAATATITVAENDEPTLQLQPSVSQVSEAMGRQTIGFEDIGSSLAVESFNNGANRRGGFDSGSLHFPTFYDPTYGGWSGWAVSNTSDVTTPGYMNQFSAYAGVDSVAAGGGANDSASYAVASNYGSPLTISLPASVAGAAFESIAITNTTYAALSMLQGDDFAKKFGGESGADPDFFLLQIEGLNSADESVGTIDFYLADYRSEDNSLDYVVSDWTTVDLSTLAGATSLRFGLSSSDVGAYGMNTPAYFAIDDVVITRSAVPAPSVVVHRNTIDVSEELTVTLQTDPTSRLTLPSSVVIPAGADRVTVPITVIDDAEYRGDQNVQMTVGAAGFIGGAASLEVLEDDRPRIVVASADQDLASENLAVEEAGAAKVVTVQLQQPPANGTVTLTVADLVAGTSASSQLGISPSQLTFTATNWDQPQTVSISGLPDLLAEQTQVIGLQVRDHSSEYEAAPVWVELADYQPASLTLRREGNLVQLVDDARDVVFGEYADDAEIRIALSDQTQRFTLEPVGGDADVSVTLGGGNDTLRLNSSSFTLFDAGAGQDVAILAPNDLEPQETVDVADWLSARVIGFETIVLGSDSVGSASLSLPFTLDAAKLTNMFTTEAPRFLTSADQDLEFVGDWQLGEAELIDGLVTQRVVSDGIEVAVATQHPWQNSHLRFDVNANGKVTARDALSIINRLNADPSTALPMPQSADELPAIFYDVSGDGQVTALDALQVINWLNDNDSGSSSESPSGEPMQAVVASEFHAPQSPARTARSLPPSRVQVLDGPAFRPLQVDSSAAAELRPADVPTPLELNSAPHPEAVDLVFAGPELLTLGDAALTQRLQ